MPKKKKKERKQKKKLTPEQRREKNRRQAEFMTVFINGKQKQVRRSPTIDEMDVEEFIRRNADPIWLHQNEMWELIEVEPAPEWARDSSDHVQPRPCLPKPLTSENEDDSDIPF